MLIVFYLSYTRNISHREKMKIRKDTIDFCFCDNTNYEDIINKAVFEGYSFDREGEKMPESQILFILTTFDKLSIALKNNVFDERIIIEYYGKYFLHFYGVCRFFIIKRREMSKNPDLFIEYEKLVIRWKSETNLLDWGI